MADSVFPPVYPEINLSPAILSTINTIHATTVTSSLIPKIKSHFINENTPIRARYNISIEYVTGNRGPVIKMFSSVYVKTRL